MKVVALLPMKANSERVKGKNFKEFCGKPLFQWVLGTLLSVDEIDKVIINTDARSILANNGLTGSDRIVIRDRVEEICGDFVSMNVVIADDVSNVEADVYLMTHTTNPLISKKTIERALKQFVDKKKLGFDSLFTVNKIQSRFYDKDCTALNHDPNNLVRTQDLPPLFEENSNLYVFSRDSFKNTLARIGKKPSMLETPLYESTDIDTVDDWEMAEALVKHFISKGKL